MLIIPEVGIRISYGGVCPDAALTDPRRNETLHEYVKLLCQRTAYDVFRHYVRHSTYQGVRTGTMNLQCVVMDQAQYEQLVRDCYEQGLRDASRESLYTMEQQS